MARMLVTDELWAKVEPLLPEFTPSPKGGRPQLSDRACLTGILFVFKPGIAWEDLSSESWKLHGSMLFPRKNLLEPPASGSGDFMGGMRSVATACGKGSSARK